MFSIFALQDWDVVALQNKGWSLNAAKGSFQTSLRMLKDAVASSKLGSEKFVPGTL